MHRGAADDDPRADDDPGAGGPRGGRSPGGPPHVRQPPCVRSLLRIRQSPRVRQFSRVRQSWRQAARRSRSHVARASVRPPADHLPLFLFGTLRDANLFAAVFGRPQSALACRDAYVPDHAAMRVEGADFPVLVAAPGRRQAGLLVGGLAPAEVARAVFYESSGYELAAITVRAAGAAVTARAFLPTGRLPVSGERWRLSAWQRRHRARVVAAAHLAMRHLGRLDAAGFEALWPEIERAVARLAAAGDGTGRPPAATRRRTPP